MLSRELSHRIKNIFAVIAGLIGLSVRQDPAAKDFANGLRECIAALGRAHEFVRPHSEESRPTIERTTLNGMLQGLFRPYPAMDSGQITIAGDNIVIDDRGATPLTLLFHELATNAAKYGALSTHKGRVAIDITVRGGDATVCWKETGGPVFDAPETSPVSARAFRR